MQKIKIMHITNDMGIGGVQQIVLSLLKGFDRKTFKLFVACVTGAGSLLKEIKDLDIDVRYYPCIRRNRIFKWISPWQIYKLARWIKREKIDIVHTHLFLGGTIGRLSAILAGVPVIIHIEHNTYIRKKFYHIWIDRFLSMFTKRIITVSRAVKDFTVKQEKIPAEKFTVIYNGIDHERFSLSADKDSIRKKFKIPTEVPIVGSVGRLVSQKGYDIFFHAAKQVQQAISPVKFLLVGDGSQRSQLEQLVARLGISKDVIFTGYFRNSVEAMESLDVFVLSSIYEGFGLSLVEALARGKPVVATNVGAVPEIIEHGVNGRLVPARDFSAMAREIVFLLKNKEIAQKLGEAGKKMVRERFCSDRMINETESLYKNILKQQN